MILIGAGSSLSFCGQNPAGILEAAARAVGRLGALTGTSPFYASDAWPDPADPPFTNACFALETSLSPQALLAALLAIEAGFGRRRRRQNGPRTLDLDLLDYGGLILARDDPPALALPHPRLADRRFVLAPLRDLAPGWRHPATGASVDDLLAAAPGAVRRLTRAT